MAALAFLAAALVGAAGFAVALGQRRTITLPGLGGDALRRLRRRSRVGRVVGLAAGLVAGALVAEGWPHLLVTGLGLGAALAPTVAVAVMLVVFCVAEATAPVAHGTRRTATLGTRRPTDSLPAGLTTLGGGAVGVAAVLLAVGWSMGDADDLGRAGRSLATTCRDSAGAVVGGGAVGPWPGSYYAVPMLLGLAATLAVALATLVAVARRPRPSAESAAADDLLRRDSARVVLLGLAALGFCTAAPVSVLMASALAHVSCAPTAYRVLGVVLVAVGVAAAGLGAWALGSVLVAPSLGEGAVDSGADRHVDRTVEQGTNGR